MKRGLASALFLLLAALSVSLLLARPLCDAGLWHAHAAPSDDPACCSSLEQRTHSKSPNVAATTAGGQPLPALPAFFYLLAAALFAGPALRLISAQPPARSFYARSARILR